MEETLKHTLLAAILVISTGALGRITDPGTPKIEPFADGAPFGGAGAYERVSGVARVEKVTQAARSLVADRLLLQEDADAYVKAAQARRW